MSAGFLDDERRSGHFRQAGIHHEQRQRSIAFGRCAHHRREFRIDKSEANDVKYDVHHDQWQAPGPSSAPGAGVNEIHRALPWYDPDPWRRVACVSSADTGRPPPKESVRCARFSSDLALRGSSLRRRDGRQRASQRRPSFGVSSQDPSKANSRAEAERCMTPTSTDAVRP